MSPRTQLIGVVAIVLALVLIMELVRRRQLRTGYSLLWLFIGLVVLVLVPTTKAEAPEAPTAPEPAAEK